MRLLTVVPNITSYLSLLDELGQSLAQSGVEIHCACRVDPLFGLVKLPAANLVQIHPVDFPRGSDALAYWSAARQLRDLVAALRPALIHAHFSPAIFSAALARQSDWPATLATYHGLAFPVFNGLKGFAIQRAEVWSAQRMDCSWVVTQEDRDHLRRVAPRLPVRRLPGFGSGCRLDEFDRTKIAPWELAHARSLLGLRGGECVFAYIGRQVESKGFGLTVRAFFELLKECPEARLLLIGGRDRFERCGLSELEEQQLQGCSKCISIEEPERVARWLAVADVMVLPSQREGLSIALMEALAMGVPAITSDARGCREIVRHGIDGEWIREWRVPRLTETMAKFCRNPLLRRQYAQGALLGRTRFDRAQAIAEQLRIYRPYLNLGLR